jgi:predicted transcriptional regulator
MAGPRDVQRSFRLPAELDAALVATAIRLDRSVSWVIVASLEAAIYGEQEAFNRAVGRGAMKFARKTKKDSGKSVPTTPKTRETT